MSPREKEASRFLPQIIGCNRLDDVIRIDCLYLFKILRLFVKDLAKLFIILGSLNSYSDTLLS